MQPLKYKTAELIEILKKNRDEHKGLFDKAILGWLKSVGEAAQSVVAAGTNEIKVRKELQGLYSHLQCPADETAAYDHAIRKLELTTQDEIELDDREFKSFVEDDWDWKNNWMTSNSAYAEQ